jgi:hypothetical protein
MHYTIFRLFFNRIILYAYVIRKKMIYVRVFNSHIGSNTVLILTAH